VSSVVTVDTQVIVYADYLGDASEVRGCHACSVALAEYLMMQTDDYLSAAYYLPTRSSPTVGRPIDWNRLQKERPSAWARRHTHSIPVVLRSTVPPVTILYWGMSALADIINDRDRARFQTSVSRLVPCRRLRILHKLDFVLQADMSCDALTKEDTELGLELMKRFMKANTPKEDVRNTVNDMLVLASSMNRGLVLRTDDTLLDDFAEKQLDAHSTPQGNNLVDLSTPKIGYRRQSTGTKGYVNRFQ
jgi:hypothetical protein